MSKDILAGVPRDEAERERMELLRGDFAAKFARAGFLTIAPDAAGFGERIEEASLGQTRNNCQHLSVNALSLGMSLQGIRVWEILQALDYLGGRPDVQPDRIAVAGLSMGCEHAMYVAALDERVRASVLSCGPRAIIPDAKHISWCACLFSPGIFNEMDWPDITALIAPSPIQLQFGDVDYIPLDLARETNCNAPARVLAQRRRARTHWNTTSFPAPMSSISRLRCRSWRGGPAPGSSLKQGRDSQWPSQH